MTTTVRRWMYLAAVAAVVLGLAMSARSIGPTVIVAPVNSSQADMIVAAGVVEPASEEVQLANEIGGTLHAVIVREGERVQAGQVVATLVDDQLQAELASARFLLEQRSGELRRIRAGARVQQRLEAEANLRVSQAHFDSVDAALARLRPLVSSGFVTRAAVDNAVAARREAEGERDAAAERYSLINAPPRAEDVQIAVAAEQAAAADVRRAAAAADRATIRAPISGTVLRVLARPGEVVAVLRPTVVATIGDLRSLNVRTEVDEADIGRVALEQRAYVTVDAYPGRRFGGVVTRTAERMGSKQIAVSDPSSRKDAMVLEVIIRLDQGVALPIGLRCDVFIAPRGRPDALGARIR